MGQVANVLSFAVGYVAGSESARRSVDAARQTLDDVRARANALRGRADDVRVRAGAIRARADRLLASTARGARTAIAQRPVTIRIPEARSSDLLSDIRSRASSVVDRAARAVDLADAAIRRMRLELTTSARPGRADRHRRLRRSGRSAPPRRDAAPTVERLMRRVTAVVDPDDAIRVAAVALGDAQDGTAVAVEGDKVVGILTPRHLVRSVAEGLDPLSTGIVDVMSPAPITIPRHATLADAEVLVRYLAVDGLVVVEGGRAIGIVHATDIREAARS